MCCQYLLYSRFSTSDGGFYCELQYIVKVPIAVFQPGYSSQDRKYKYHVESPATAIGFINSLEFIVGPSTTGGIIDRSMKLHSSGRLQSKCE